MKLVIMGAQGSGKGTQATLLANKYKIPAISVGARFRAEIRKGTAIGDKIAPYVLEGKLIPDKMNNKIVQEILNENEEGFILDGYPRDMNQAKFLDKVEKIDRVIVLKISDEEALRRITMRRICPDCGANYNLAFVRTQVEGMCDHCHGELIKRADDKPALIKKRLKIYHGQTEAVIQYFREKEGKIMEVDGNRPIKDVYAEIVRRLRTKT